MKSSKTISSDGFGEFVTFVFNITYLIVSISLIFKIMLYVGNIKWYFIIF